MGLPKVPYFGKTNPVIAAQSSARTDLSACRLATRTDHDTMPNLSAGRGYRTNSPIRVRNAGCKWLCEPRRRDELGRTDMCMVWVGVTGMGVSRDQISSLEYGTPAAITPSAAMYWGTGHPKALASADPRPAISGKVALNQRPRLPTSVYPAASSLTAEVPDREPGRHNTTHTLPTTHQQLLASTPKAP